MPAEGQGNELKIGQLMQDLVRSLDKVRKVVFLSSDSDSMSKSVTNDLKSISIDLIVPGVIVNSRVKSILENGVMLSFLTYFTAVVIARTLFIDPSSKAVGLTLNPHLVQNKTPPSHVNIGDIYNNTKVVRVDKGSGLLLEVPSIPESAPAFVNISKIAEEEIKKLGKKFKEGNHVRVRILGLKLLEELATVVLKRPYFFW